MFSVQKTILTCLYGETFVQILNIGVNSGTLYESFLNGQFHTVRNHYFTKKKRSFLTNCLHFTIKRLGFVIASLHKKHLVIGRTEKS